MDGAGEGRIVGRKHVCVLYGGRSLERDVSINTGTRVARALEARDLPRAMVSALSFDRKVMLEEFISGRELAVSIVGTQDPRVLPIVEAVPKSGHDFYDFESRYTPGETEFNVPASLESAVAEEVERISLETYRALGCSGFGRVDIILDAADRPWILELNTIPGLTETSLMPAAAEAAGLPFEDLVEMVVATAFEPKAE